MTKPFVRIIMHSVQVENAHLAFDGVDETRHISLRLTLSPVELEALKEWALGTIPTLTDIVLLATEEIDVPHT